MLTNCTQHRLHLGPIGFASAAAIGVVLALVSSSPWPVVTAIAFAAMTIVIAESIKANLVHRHH